MNPMVLMMVVPLLLVVVLPKLINTSDPQLQRVSERNVERGYPPNQVAYCFWGDKVVTSALIDYGNNIGDAAVVLRKEAQILVFCVERNINLVI